MKTGIKISLILLLLIPSSASAQMKDAFYVIGVTPTMTNRFISFKDNSYETRRDSLNGMDRWRDALGASLSGGFKTGKKTRIMIGLHFHNLGFTRRRENLKFKDTIHPDIGIMSDLSQTGNNYVDFNYRYMYMSLPFLYSFQFGGASLKSNTLHFIIGGSVSGLINHDIRAVFHGFSLRGGDKVRVLKNEDATTGLFNANLHLGLRLENPVYGKSTFVFVQPTFYLPVLPANYDNERHHLFAVGIEVGLMFRPGVEDKKE